MIKKFYYVYRLDIIFGPLKDHFYIGQHGTNNLNDNYHSSSKIVNGYIKNYPNCYRVTILEYCNNVEECCLTEKKYISEYINDPKNLNQIIGYYNYNRTKEQCDHYAEIAKTWIGEKNGFFGKHHTDYTKQLISSKAKERYKDPEYVKRISKAISEALKGEKNPFYGKHHTDKTKQEISNTKKLYFKTHTSYQTGKKCINNGIKQIWVNITELDEYINNGWKLGMLKHNLIKDEPE